MFYFCSLGSNIDPTANVCAALEALTHTLSSVTLSPLIQTEPHGMESHLAFCNAFFWFDSERTQDDIKSLFNHIEEQQGRDRSDPDKKIKDRPIDLDILYAGARCPLSDITVEDPYLAALTPVLRGMAPTTSAVSMPFAGKRLGLRIVTLTQTPTGVAVETCTAW